MTTCPTCGRRLSERNGAGSEPDTCGDSCHDLADRAIDLRGALYDIKCIDDDANLTQDEALDMIEEVVERALYPQATEPQ